MTHSQLLAFAVLGGMMLLFMWGRLRYDLVAGLSLMVAVAVGIVPAKEAFTGFSDDIVIIVASALIVSAAVGRSGIIEMAIHRLAGGVTRISSQLLVLVGSVTVMSGLVKNIGALAMMMPAAIQMARKSRTSPSVFLMPMSFGSLLGGLVTLVGTSPNIIVSRVREEITGKPFGMFDYAPVGIGLAIAGIIFLRFGYRLLPRDRHAAAGINEALDIQNYMTEARIGDGSPAIGLTVSEFRTLTENEVIITAILRGEGRNTVPLPDARLDEGDLLLIEGEPGALERAISRAELVLDGQDRAMVTEAAGGEVGVVEAVITPESILDGQAAGRIALHDFYGVNLLAVSRRGQRLTERLRDIMLRAGDVVVIQGRLDGLSERMQLLGCLPLAERPLRLGSVRRGLIPVIILGVAMALTALGIVPVAMAFLGAAMLIVFTGALPAREAYDHIEWPIIIMLGALIPVSDSLRTTGASDIIAHWLSTTAVTLPGWGAVMLILVAAMAVTPFLNNAATVLVMAPIAASFAGDLGYRPEAFFMATAVGAGCDFLTPIGHQCNTLVMGPGGYRFSDYARLGAPLSLIVILVGVPLILLFWPL